MVNALAAKRLLAKGEGRGGGSSMLTFENAEEWIAGIALCVFAVTIIIDLRRAPDAHRDRPVDDVADPWGNV